MTPEKQRIKIAEACGWHEKPEPHGSFNASAWWQNEHRYPSYEMPVPNYPEDLNAMHEAVSILDYDQADRFEDYLCDICKRSNDKKDNPVPWRFAVVNATAAQRARAFLETLGLWENGSD